jgi:hypothetical protein
MLNNLYHFFRRVAKGRKFFKKFAQTKLYNIQRRTDILMAASLLVSLEEFDIIEKAFQKMKRQYIEKHSLLDWNQRYIQENMTPVPGHWRLIKKDFITRQNLSWDYYLVNKKRHYFDKRYDKDIYPELLKDSWIFKDFMDKKKAQFL